MTRLTLSGLALCMVGLVGTGDEKPPARPITNADTVMALYREDHGLGARVIPALVVAIWPDGHAVWSADRLRGGPPYRSGTVETRKVTDLLQRYERDGLFADETLNHARFGPDSTFHTMFIKSGGKKVRMQSWHELGESNGAVATSHGLTSTDRKRLEVLKGEPATYLYYRMVWAETRAHIFDLLPAEGKPTVGELVTVKPTEWAWQESIRR